MSWTLRISRKFGRSISQTEACSLALGNHMSPGVSRFAFLTIQGEFLSWEHEWSLPLFPFFPHLLECLLLSFILSPYFFIPSSILVSFITHHILLFFLTSYSTSLHHFYSSLPLFFILHHPTLFHLTSLFHFFPCPYFISPLPLYSPTLSFIPPLPCLFHLAPFIQFLSILLSHITTSSPLLITCSPLSHINSLYPTCLFIPPHHFYSALPPLFHLTLFIQFLSIPSSHVTPCPLSLIICSPLSHLTPFILFLSIPLSHTTLPLYSSWPALLYTISSPCIQLSPLFHLTPSIAPHPLYSIFLHPFIPCRHYHLTPAILYPT